MLDLLARSPVLTLTGPPGVGKSRLAGEVARRLNAPGPMRAVVVELGWLTATAQVASAVTEDLVRLRNASSGDQDPGRGLVMVLDDCDRVLSECARVAHGLRSQGVRVLATAREQLVADGEVVWRVPPLSLPLPGHDGLPELFTGSEAVQLFCDRAASVRRDLIPTPEDAAAVSAICRRLDGIPLAVELAARSVTAYSPADVVARLDDPFSLLTGGARTDHPRHQSMWASVAWSYDALPAPERVLFDRLGVFPGSFTGEAASDVCGDDGLDEAQMSGMLRALVDRSLLEVEIARGRARYRFLHVVRRFAMDQLAAAGQLDELRAGHARWCAESVEAAGDPRSGRPWMERVLPCHDDVHAAVDWAVASGQAETAVVLGEAYVRLCRAEGRYRAAGERVRQVIAGAVPASPGLRARALAAAAMAETAAGHLAAAEAHLQHSANIAERAGERTELARARLWLAFIAVLGSGRTALAPLEAAAAEARGAGNPHLVIEALAASGRAHLLVGEPAKAHDEFAESADLAREHGDEVGQARALVGLGAAGVVLGRYGDAEALLVLGLDLAKALGEVEAAVEALVWLGESAQTRGQPGTAEDWFTDAAELARATEHPGLLTQALLGLGRITADRGEPAVAQGLFEEALGQVRGGAVPYLLAPCLCGLAEVVPDPARTGVLVGEALSAAQRHGDWSGEASAFHLLADLSRANGDLRAAALRHSQALALRAKVGDPAGIANSLEAVAGVAAARERFGIAARLLGAAEAVRDRHGCATSGSHRPEQAAVIETVRRALTEDAFDAEWREGRALSWPTAVRYALGQKDLRVPRRSTGLGALTAAERRVAELAAQGWTNAEIARALDIVSPTVKAHLRRVFAKVGVQTRTALAARMHGSIGR